MLLNNYFNYVGLLFGKSAKMTNLAGRDGSINSIINYTQKCLVGSGNRPAKVDDYALEEEITGIDTTFNVNVSESGTKIVNIISNLTNNAVTISEVGIACFNSMPSERSSGYLMTRTVLDEPIVLEVGDVVVIETQFA